MMTPGHLLTELKRRHVLRVVGAYAVAAWIAVEVFTTIQPILLGSYAWANRLVVILALAGFPITFALAWVFDITPEGVRRTSALDATAADGFAAPASAPSLRSGLPARATGFFGLGILVALVSFAAIAGLGDEADRINSIAVLPFRDLSSTHDQQFFSDGIAEELLNRLTQVENMKVPSRTLSFALAEQKLDPREIGRRLGVSTILEGSVRREAGHVRVTATLTDSESGDVIWSKQLEGSDQDIFALQDSISTAIVDELKLRLAGAPSGEAGTTSKEAHEAYLKALTFFHERTDTSLRSALELLKNALREDPLYADALALLAQTYAVLPVYGSFSVDTAVVRGYEAASAALARNPANAGAYAAMGQIAQNYEWDPVSAERYYQNALQTSKPETARQWYAETLLLLGRYDEAMLQIDSMSSKAEPVTQHVIAYIQMMRGDTDGALATWRTAMRLHPEFTAGAHGHAYAAIAANRNVEAARTLKQLGERNPERRTLYEAIANALLDPAARTAAQASIGTARDLPDAERAAWSMAVGDRAGALAALQKGFRQHTDVNVPFLLIHPLFAPLRGEQAVRDMVAETGISFRN
jgi:adenylate cyclase